MRKLTMLTAALTLPLSVGYAVAGEGNGNPFPYGTAVTVTQGQAFVAETGSDAYPMASGNRMQSSSLSGLAPAPSNEQIVQSYFEAGVAHPAG